MFKLANAATKRGLPNKQDLGRAPKASVIGRRHGISEVLQIDGGCSVIEDRIL
jgi:hypothetical protein